MEKYTSWGCDSKVLEQFRIQKWQSNHLLQLIDICVSKIVNQSLTESSDFLGIDLRPSRPPTWSNVTLRSTPRGSASARAENAVKMKGVSDFRRFVVSLRLTCFRVVPTHSSSSYGRRARTSGDISLFTTIHTTVGQSDGRGGFLPQLFDIVRGVIVLFSKQRNKDELEVPNDILARQTNRIGIRHVRHIRICQSARTPRHVHQEASIVLRWTRKIAATTS